MFSELFKIDPQLGAEIDAEKRLGHLLDVVEEAKQYCLAVRDMYMQGVPHAELWWSSTVYLRAHLAKAGVVIPAAKRL